MKLLILSSRLCLSFGERWSGTELEKLIALIKK